MLLFETFVVNLVLKVMSSMRFDTFESLMAHLVLSILLNGKFGI